MQKRLVKVILRWGVLIVVLLAIANLSKSRADATACM
jgi:hypothetical protein